MGADRWIRTRHSVLGKPLCFQFFEKLNHHRMSVLCKLSRRRRIHQILEQQQLLMKVIDGGCKRSVMLAAERKGPCDPDRTDGVQSVRVLYDHALQRAGPFLSVFAERNGCDRVNDPLSFQCIELRILKETSRVCIVFRMEELVIIRVVQQRGKRDHFRIRLGIGSYDTQRIVIDPKGVICVVSVRVAGEKRLNISNRAVNDRLIYSACFSSTPASIFSVRTASA